eukprot:9500872-Pyramimonas_sp.AAC.1
MAARFKKGATKRIRESNEDSGDDDDVDVPAGSSRRVPAPSLAVASDDDEPSSEKNGPAAKFKTVVRVRNKVEPDAKARRVVPV